MGRKLTSSSSDREFQILDEGTYLAICTAQVAIGMQETHFGEKDQLKTRFEVPSERVTYEKDGETVEGPMVVWKTYTASLNEKANLRKDLESWRGRKFTDAELEGWDISATLGKPCMITIVHSDSGGKTYANVATVTGIPKGMKVPAHEGDLLDFNNESYTPAQFEALPGWLQDKVRDGEELAKRQRDRVEEGNRRAAEASHSAASSMPERMDPSEYRDDTFTDDDIPF